MSARMLNTLSMSQDIKRRLCKFTSSWCLFKEFQSWLVPVKYQNQKAYCILCKRVFSVSHSGLHDVKAHWKGKKHLQLQEQEMEKCVEETVESNEIKGFRFMFNEELNIIEETVGDPRDFQEDNYRPREKNLTYLENDRDDIIVENILTPTVTLESDHESSQPATGKSQQYCLRWKYHHNNLQVMFIQLLQRESFCDVTLACEGKMLRAHKVVLSACSTYFDKIFSEHEEKDPVVILKDVKFNDIKDLVEFMYKGEINVENSHLSSLLKTAEDLKIKGLADVSGKSIPKDDDYPPKATIMSAKEAEALAAEEEKHINDDPMIDYEDLFTPHIVDESVSNDDSDNEADTNGKYQDERPKPKPRETGPTFLEPQNEQSFSTLIAHLSDNPAQVTQQEVPREEVNTSTEDASSEMASLTAQFPDVIKMNDYLTTGRRQQFWEEPFTRRLMEAIKNKEIEMKAAAELMGVSYGTLYGRYRDAYGCLKHPYRTKDFWSEQGPADILAKLQKKEITLFRAAEMLNVTVTTLANYLSTLRYERGEQNGAEEEEMDINESINNFNAENKNRSGEDGGDEEDEDEDSRSSSGAVDRSEEDYP